MNLRYQTATATFIQLAVMTLLIVIGGIKDVASNCENSMECVTNSFLWIIIIFILAGWYLTLFAIGYFAQEKRSHRLARLLIAGELFTVFVALMLVKSPSSLYSGVSAGVALVLGIWIIVLAWRLNKARGGRITTKKKRSTERPRRRLTD